MRTRRLSGGSGHLALLGDASRLSHEPTTKDGGSATCDLR